MVDSPEDVERDKSMPSFVFDPEDSGFGRLAVSARATWASAAWASAANPRGLPVLVVRACATCTSAAGNPQSLPVLVVRACATWA